TKIPLRVIERVKPAGVLADNERPTVGRWQHPDRVRSRGHAKTTEQQLFVAVECRGLVCAGTPDLSVGHQGTKDRPPAHRRATVDDRELCAVDGVADALVRADSLALRGNAGDTEARGLKSCGNSDDDYQKSDVHPHVTPPL